ncbi:MAG: response regulator [Oscillospiraceae bacterium]|jgi:two-component system response regulator (stage 0 sporulation protein A)|nr:response regulator [Oscillospiraceae bacterium]
MIRYNVLIIDDEADWRRLLSKRLSEENMFIVTGEAGDGSDAIHFIEDTRPDVIIVDIVMPKLSGKEVVQYAREKIDDYDPVIYAITGYNTIDIRSSLGIMDIDCYNLKPVEPDFIVNNLKKIIEQREMSSIFLSDSQDKKEKFVMDLLRRIGAPIHLGSTFQTCKVMMAYLENYMDTSNKIRDLYVEVARTLNVTSASVERNLRSTIKNIQANNTKLFEEIFRHESDKKITNMMFLRVMGLYIASVSEGRVNSFDKLFV